MQQREVRLNGSEEMSQPLVVHLDEATAQRLWERARRDGMSVEEEARQLLIQALRSGWSVFWAEAERIQESLRGRSFADSSDLIREDRDR